MASFEIHARYELTKSEHKVCSEACMYASVCSPEYEAHPLMVARCGSDSARGFTFGFEYAICEFALEND